MAPHQYFAEEQLAKSAPHHTGIKTLWETKWKPLCQKAVYPFGDGKFEDFQKVFETLIAMDLKEPYDPDVYAAVFFPVAEPLVSQAEAAEKAGSTKEAFELYLRAAALYRIARFPINLPSGNNAIAWQRGKEAYLRAGPYFSPPLHEVWIPHTHGVGDETGSKIPAYIRIPTTTSPSSPLPVILFITGLDGYRTDQTAMVQSHLNRGFAVILAEIPGTGDCPSIRNDPKSPDRLWSSVLDWIDSQEEIDSKRIVARGVSTGAHYALRIAHTHRERILASVAHGMGCHYMFDKRWIGRQNLMEYPFGLADTLAYKFGYPSTSAYIEDSQKRFSLLESGILDKPSAPLFLVNGMEDSIFPIEDSLLALQHGDVKNVRFVPNSKHMGFPDSEKYVYDWIDGLFN